MQLIVCCDGTWNDPDDGTHIHRICQAGRAALPDPENVYYGRGVGLEPGMRLSGAALGKGLSENVRDAYRWLVRHHADGAEIYIFGFSRGAYTARSLTGLMNYAGLLQPQDEDSIKDAYAAGLRGALAARARTRAASSGAAIGDRRRPSRPPTEVDPQLTYGATLLPRPRPSWPTA